MLLSRFCGWADCDVLAQMMLYYEWTCTRPRQLFSVGHNCKGNARVCRCVCVCVCVCVCACVSVCAMQTNPEMLQKSRDHSPGQCTAQEARCISEPSSSIVSKNSSLPAASAW